MRARKDLEYQIALESNVNLTAQRSELRIVVATTCNEFRIMRDDVFGTDQAVIAAMARLHSRGTTASKMAAFQQRAESASTPEQVGVIEREVTP